MTDARFPERWLNDRRIVTLPDNAFRLHVMALAWSVANRTDGVIEDDELRLIPADPTMASKLMSAGLWRRQPGMWIIDEFEATQTTAADLEHLAAQRAKTRDRVRRHRARSAARNVTRDVTRYSSRTGQARPGTKTEGRDPDLRPSEASPDLSSSAAHEVRRSELAAAPQPGNPPGHDASNPVASDAQHIPIEVQRKSQAAGRNARASDEQRTVGWHDWKAFKGLSPQRQTQLYATAAEQLGRDASDRDILDLAAQLARALP